MGARDGTGSIPMAFWRTTGPDSGQKTGKELQLKARDEERRFRNVTVLLPFHQLKCLLCSIHVFSVSYTYKIAGNRFLGNRCCCPGESVRSARGINKKAQLSSWA